MLTLSCSNNRTAHYVCVFWGIRKVCALAHLCEAYIDTTGRCAVGNLYKKLVCAGISLRLSGHEEKVGVCFKVFLRQER